MIDAHLPVNGFCLCVIGEGAHIMRRFEQSIRICADVVPTDLYARIANTGGEAAGELEQWMRAEARTWGAVFADGGIAILRVEPDGDSSVAPDCFKPSDEAVRLLRHAIMAAASLYPAIAAKYPETASFSPAAWVTFGPGGAEA